MGSLQPGRTNGVSRYGVIVAGFIACAMVLGGGGSPGPWSEVILQLLFALGGLLWFWWCPGAGKQPGKVPQILWIGGAVLLAIPILQLVPLPPFIWQSLPHRELQVATLELLGQEQSWRALTISPPLTVAGLLALAPAVGVMWATASMGANDRRAVLLTIAVMAVVGAMLGALQMASGPQDFRLYDQVHRGWLTAFHANRNAAADVLLIGSLALSAWFAKTQMDRPDYRKGLPLFAAAQLLLVVALVLTGSRAGIALQFLVLPFHWWILKPEGLDLHGKTLLAGVGFVAAVLAALPFALAGNSRLARVAERFDARGDARVPLWEDTLAAIGGYWPAGSGVGTFPIAFQPFESPEYLDPGFANRAHNDYLEILLETGGLAIPLLMGGFVILALLARRAWKMSPQDHAQQLYAQATLAVVALHSLLDYPLRNMAIACLAGVAAGLLTVPRRQKSSGQAGVRREDAT